MSIGERYDRARRTAVEYLALGPFEVRREGRVVPIGAGKQRALLVFLLLHANKPVSRDRLIDELWGSQPPATVTTSLRVRLAELRRLLEPGRAPGAESGVIVGTEGRLTLRVDPDSFDLLRFEALVVEADGAMSEEQPEAAVQLLREALVLWRGPVLEEFRYEPFAQSAIARLEQLRATALERRIDADLALGDHTGLVPELEELIAGDPYRERLRAQLMLALYRSGRQSDALAAYQDARRQFADALGIEPGPELKQLEQDILQQSPELQPTQPAVSEPAMRSDLRNPYKGLRPFTAADAEDFFGRDRLVEELLDRLRLGKRFVCVVGASGSGKSSVVRAGLVPRLESARADGLGSLRVVEVVPGADPLGEIENALLRLAERPGESLIEQLEGDPHGLRRAVSQVLPDDGSELLLVVDQFEELFTMVADENLRRHVLESIRLAVSQPRSRVRVVATLRADFYDRPLAYREFARLLEENVLTVLPLSAQELEQVITGPARAVGAHVEHALVTEIVADVNHQPGALPLVQYAMTELFESRDSDVLTVEDYRAVGGVSGAIAARAERLYADLHPEEQHAARRLFSRLVTLGEGAEDTRRRVPRSEVEPLGQGGQIKDVIDAYTAHRFLSADRDPTTQGATVEIAHEALLREWPRLRMWIDDDRDGLRVLRHLGDTAAAWDRMGRDNGELYRGVRLDRALAWAKDHASDLAPVELDFIKESRELRDAEARVEQERIAQRARQNRRLKIALVLVALALAGAIAGGVVALDQRAEANRQAERAETGRLVAEAAARAGDNRRLGLLLAAEVHRRAPSVETLGALQRVLVSQGGFQGYLGAGGDYVALEFSSDASRLTALGPDTVEVYDVATGALLSEFPVEEAALAEVIFVKRASGLGKHGEEVVVGSSSGEVIVYATKDGSVATRFRPGGPPISGVGLDSAGRRIAVGHEDGTVSVWRREGLEQAYRLSAHGRGVTELAFSPDGARLATGSARIDPEAGGDALVEPARLWDAMTGTPLGPDLPVNPDNRSDLGPSLSIVFGGDGSTLITSGARTIRQWSVPSGELLSTFSVPIEGVDRPEVDAIASLPGGRVAASVHESRLVLHDAASGERIADAEAELSVSSAGALAAAADGSLVAMGGEAGVFVWSPTGQRLLARAFPAGIEEPGTLALLDDDRLLGGVRWPRAPIVWDLRQARPEPVRFAEPGYLAALHEGDALGMFFFMNDQEARTELWDAQTLTKAVTFEAAGFVDIAAHREKGWLVQGFGNGELFVSDIETGELLEERSGFVSFASAGTFNADGTRLVTSTPNGDAALWDTDTWQPVREVRTSDGDAIRTARFSPSGQLVTADQTGTIVVRDPETLEILGAPMIGHRGAENGVELHFSADGTRLLSSGQEAILWDLETRARIGTSFPAGGARTAVRSDRHFTVDGENILEWNLDTSEWHEIACRAAGRNMTRAEWEEFGPQDEEYTATCPQWPLEP